MLSPTYSDSKIQIKTFIGLAPTPCLTCTLCIVCRHVLTMNIAELLIIINNNQSLLTCFTLDFRDYSWTAPSEADIGPKGLAFPKLKTTR